MSTTRNTGESQRFEPQAKSRAWLIPVLLVPGIGLLVAYAVTAINYGRGSWQSWTGLGVVAGYIGFILLVGRRWKS